MERKRERDEEKSEGEMDYKASEAYMNEGAPAAEVPAAAAEVAPVAETSEPEAEAAGEETTAAATEE
jgi:hypothetical protein